MKEIDMTEQAQLAPIAMSENDAERLAELSSAASNRFSKVADFLVREISRARILADGEEAPGLVRMGSVVEFRDAASGQARTVALVYPEAADVSAGKVSILTPIGAALIGLSVGQSLQYQTPSGEWRTAEVLAVRNA
jgi:regulator of nucleoside diphosphate kinase